MELQPKEPCGSLQVSRYYFRIAWICWVDECSHGGCCRDHLVQEFQALRPHFQIQRGHAGDVATRVAKAGNKPSRDWIGCYPEDDCNRRTRCLCRKQVRPSRQSRPHGGEPDRLPTPAVDRSCSAPSGLDRHVLAFDEGGPVQTATELGHEMPGPLGRLTVEEPDYRHRRLLRARRERPRCRTAKKGDESAALHSMTSSAIASIPGGMVTPSA